LNGFNFSLSAETFVAQRMALPDNKQLKARKPIIPDSQGSQSAYKG
jgi:hypothetical protein